MIMRSGISGIFEINLCTKNRLIPSKLEHKIHQKTWRTLVEFIGSRNKNYSWLNQKHMLVHCFQIGVFLGSQRTLLNTTSDPSLFFELIMAVKIFEKTTHSFFQNCKNMKYACFVEQKDILDLFLSEEILVLELKSR